SLRARSAASTGRRGPALPPRKSAALLVLRFRSRTHLYLRQELAAGVRRKLALRSVNLNANWESSQRKVFGDGKGQRRGRRPIADRPFVDRDGVIPDVEDRTLGPPYRRRNVHRQRCSLLRGERRRCRDRRNQLKGRWT